MIRVFSPQSPIIGFSHHLKIMTHVIYMGAAGLSLDPDHYDAVKGEPNDDFDGLTPRQAYIHYSENVIKPLHGKEWFGEKFIQAAKNSGSYLIVVPDSGFREEAERCVREVGSNNVLLIRIHKDGCTYDGDSRSYISLGDLGVREHDVLNVHGKPQWLGNTLFDIVHPWSIAP